MTGTANDTKVTLPVGVILRRSRGVTRWARWSWSVIGILPGAGPGGWKLLRETESVAEYHAATLQLELHRADTEAYRTALAGTPPMLWVILRRPAGEPDDRPQPFFATVSAYEAQDYTDNGEDLVEPVPMPPGLLAWVEDFVERHHRDEPFIKRKRRPFTEGRAEDGVGDSRIRQAADVYRAPRSIREGRE